MVARKTCGHHWQQLTDNRLAALIYRTKRARLLQRCLHLMNWYHRGAGGWTWEGGIRRRLLCIKLLLVITLGLFKKKKEKKNTLGESQRESLGETHSARKDSFGATRPGWDSPLDPSFAWSLSSFSPSHAMMWLSKFKLGFFFCFFLKELVCRNKEPTAARIKRISEKKVRRFWMSRKKK